MRKLQFCPDVALDATQSERTSDMKRIALFTVIAILPILAACHTIQGAGQDVTAVGKGMESAASN